ncbi:hypothetical protein ABFX02_08G099200 [Erythranthe guttata]
MFSFCFLLSILSSFYTSPPPRPSFPPPSIVHMEAQVPKAFKQIMCVVFCVYLFFLFLIFFDFLCSDCSSIYKILPSLLLLSSSETNTIFIKNLITAPKVKEEEDSLMLRLL